MVNTLLNKWFKYYTAIFVNDLTKTTAHSRSTQTPELVLKPLQPEQHYAAVYYR